MHEHCCRKLDSDLVYFTKLSDYERRRGEVWAGSMGKRITRAACFEPLCPAGLFLRPKPPAEDREEPTPSRH